MNVDNLFKYILQTASASAIRKSGRRMIKIAKAAEAMAAGIDLNGMMTRRISTQQRTAMIRNRPV